MISLDENKINTPLGAVEFWLRSLIRDEIRALISVQSEEDRLLTAEEASSILSVSPDWLYRNARRLPFTRKLGPKMLRFSSRGIQSYLAARKIS